MPQEYSITSTGKAGDFFAGALLTDFIQLWSLNQSGEQASSGWTLNWHQDYPGARFTHSVLIRTTAGVPKYDRTTMLKTVGHYLLSKMPDEALSEALEGLAETYTYWKIRTRELPSSKPVSNISNAINGISYTRPIFRVNQD
jgi:hypothetical protein